MEYYHYFLVIYYTFLYLLFINLCYGDHDYMDRLENFESSTDPDNLVAKEYPFNESYDDKSIDVFIESLKGKEYKLRKDEKLSDSLHNIINGKFTIIDNVKNIENKDGKIYVPLFIGKFQETIVRRVILVLKLVDQKITVEDIILPEDVKKSDSEILPSFNHSSLVKTTEMDYKTIDKDKGLLKDDLILTMEIIPAPKKKGLDYSMCYGIPQFEKIPNKEQCNLFGGVWDKPVENNEECPFYRKNNNYPNSRGGSKYGRCELPLGMKLLGFRYYSLDEIYAPMCYGCSINSKLGNCCNSQKNPDYAFSSDAPDRKLYGLKSYSDVD